MRVTVADDRPEVRSALRLLLEQEGWSADVTEAGSSGELLDGVASFCPDLVLLDWELSDMGPEQLLPHLRAACPRSVVVALSGRPESRQAAIIAGADAFVSKGDPPERLVEALRCCHRAIRKGESA